MVLIISILEAPEQVSFMYLEPQGKHRYHAIKLPSRRCAGGYELSVMLPGVHPEHRRVELAEDGEGLSMSHSPALPA